MQHLYGPLQEKKKDIFGTNSDDFSPIMKIEWLVANVTTVWSPDRAESDILERMLEFLTSSGCYYG